MTERVERPGDRFAGPAHAIAQSVSVAWHAGRACRRVLARLGGWLVRFLRVPARALSWAGRTAARPLVAAWRLPAVGRAFAALGAFVAIVFVVVFTVELPEPHQDVGSASAWAAQNAFSALLFGIAVIGAIKGLPVGLRAARWLEHVIEVASVELHQQRASTRNTPAPPECIPARLEIIVVDSSAAVGSPWRRHSTMLAAAHIVIDSIPDGVWLALVAACDGSATVLYPATGVPVIASPESRRSARVALRLLWPSGEFDGGSALRLARDLAALHDRAEPRATLLMSGVHPTTSSLTAALDACDGRLRCDVAAFGIGGDAAHDVAERLDGRLVRPSADNNEALVELASNRLSRRDPPVAVSGNRPR